VTDTPALQLTNLSFGYQAHQPVFEGLSAAARPGVITALLGPNAVGKTTLLRTILGQLQPWTGSVTLDGRAMHDYSTSQRAAVISYVPQRGSAAFAFTVQQVVTMGRFALTRDDDAVDRAMEQAEVQHLANRALMELSVGQQQRVLIARALAQASGSGKVMLLDEPVSAMDPLHAHRVMQLLAQRAAQGLSVLIVLHDLNLAARYRGARPGLRHDVLRGR